MKFLVAISFCALLFVSTIVASGASPGHRSPVPDTTSHISILFRFDNSAVDSTFMDNVRSLALLRRIMTDEAAFSDIDSIIIMGSSSPDGNPQYNYRLAERRAISLQSYLTDNYPALDVSKIGLTVNDKYWEGLIELVEGDPDVPARNELLKTLANPALSDNAKNRRMNSMNGGATFAYLRDNFLLRRLRGTEAAIEFRPAVVLFNSVPEPESITDSIPIPIPVPELLSEPEPVPVAAESEYVKFYPVALRTNLLLDIVGGANIGVEVPIGDRFSVAADFVYAYSRFNNRYALQTIQGSVEGRYWFNRRSNLLTGWNAGVYATYCSRFDIQWGGGYQGDGYWSAGLSGGYSWRLSDNFNLDLSMTAGILWLPEIRYYDKPQDGHLMWTETRYNATRFLPTQVRANLVWLIGAKKKVK